MSDSGVSAGLADYMLRGWCLLGEACPGNPGCPLLKSREGRKICVGCKPVCPYYPVEERKSRAPQKNTEFSTTTTNESKTNNDESGRLHLYAEKTDCVLTQMTRPEALQPLNEGSPNIVDSKRAVSSLVGNKATIKTLSAAERDEIYGLTNSSNPTPCDDPCEAVKISRHDDSPAKTSDIQSRVKTDESSFCDVTRMDDEADVGSKFVDVTPVAASCVDQHHDRLLSRRQVEGRTGRSRTSNEEDYNSCHVHPPAYERQRRAEQIKVLDRKRTEVLLKIDQTGDMRELLLALDCLEKLNQLITCKNGPVAKT